MFDLHMQYVPLSPGQTDSLKKMSTPTVARPCMHKFALIWDVWPKFFKVCLPRPSECKLSDIHPLLLQAILFAQ